jgi:hypothetical protein
VGNKLVLPAQDPKYDMRRQYWMGETYDRRCEKVPIRVIFGKARPRSVKGNQRD